jgi:lipopolysaccharide biosynthesis glycosyltransferase
LIAKFLETQQSYSLETVLSLYQFYTWRRQWDRFSALTQNIQQTSLANHKEVILKQFENLCARSRMREAEEFYLEHYAKAKLRQWEACAVLRYLAEAGKWNEAGHILEEFLQEGFYFPNGDYFLLKIVRRARIHLKTIRTIDGYCGVDAPAQFAILRDLVADDVVIHARKLSGSRAKGTQIVLSRRNRVLHSDVARGRSAGAAAYLCSDQAYFLAVLTFLVSMVAQGGAGQAVDWYVFLARDVPTAWREGLERLGTKVGLRIKSVAEDEFIEGDAVHAETYGLFTGGNVLSRAAYLRIYAARYLLKQGAVERALYVDSDIVAHGDVSSLIDLPFHDALIMARAEEYSSDVRAVTEKHGLNPGQYFNSGVLVFDFTRPEILNNLDHAIALSEREPERLMFHDQCALNIAFAGKVLYLAPEYNYFLRPQRLDNGDFSSAILLHFLERPKPWDLSYSREYRALWLPHAAMVRALLEPADFNAMVAAANQ